MQLSRGMTLLAASFLNTAVPGVSLAQRVDPIGVDARLRLRAAAIHEEQNGILGRVGRDSLTPTSADYRESGNRALEQMESFEAHRPSQRGRTDHALIGALVGAVAASAALVIDVRHCEATSHSSEGPTCSIGYVALPIVLLGGAAAGAIVGALWPVSH